MLVEKVKKAIVKALIMTISINNFDFKCVENIALISRLVIALKSMEAMNTQPDNNKSSAPNVLIRSRLATHTINKIK